MFKAAAAAQVQKGVRAALVADSNITALVSTRVYDEPPQNVTYPYALVIFSRAPWTLMAHGC